MERQLLMAVDGSIHSTQSLRYATKMLGGSDEVIFTLFHGEPMISQYLLDEVRTDPRAYSALKKVNKKNKENSRLLLEKQSERLITMGIPKKRIVMVSQQRMTGLARDILEYGRKGIYDAIVVGRRGLSRAQKTFMGSTSAKLLEHSEVIPVWMVDGNVKSKKILVAVDGSESSYRAVDHIGFMLSKNPNIKYCLFHVFQDAEDMDAISFRVDNPSINKLVNKGSKRHIEKFFADAEHKLAEAGITADRVNKISAKRKGRVGKIILNEAKKGNYGTVVVGRRGTSHAHYFGSVSRYVTERITNRALWLVS